MRLVKAAKAFSQAKFYYLSTALDILFRNRHSSLFLVSIARTTGMNMSVERQRIAN